MENRSLSWQPSASHTMKAFYFGHAERQLFGVYHPPTGPRQLGHSVLLCYPGVHEYNTSHWAFRRLAKALSSAGYHVLRFDYHGTGDSSGELEEAGPSVWTDDIVTAANELKDISRARRFSVVGMRLGASLALKAVRRIPRTKTLVLWDPVVSGQEYIGELEVRGRRLSVMLLHGSRQRAAHGLCGYPFPAAQRTEIGAIDLIGDSEARADRVVVVASDDLPKFHTLCQSIESQGVKCTLRFEKDAASAFRAKQTLLSNTLLDAIGAELRASE